MSYEDTPGLDFFDDKWEQDRLRHFFYLKTVEYSEISSLAKHCVVKGHRGTGKTTLLRAVHWKERLTNEQLIHSLNDDPFSDGVLGCFHQIKYFPVALLDEWLMGSQTELAHGTISGFLRAAWLEEATSALRELNRRFSFLSLGQEIEALRDVATDFWKWAPLRHIGVAEPSDPTILTVENIETVVIALKTEIVNRAILRSPSPAATAVDLQLWGFNPLVNAIFAALARALGHWGPKRSWVFRICMDEGEFLSQQWIRSLRALIRECDAPLFLAISILEDLGTENFQEGTELSLDDRRVIDLDTRTSSEFVRLVNGIVAARIRARGLDIDNFRIQTLLGDVDFEDLVLLTIRESERRSPEITRYRGYAENDPPLRKGRRGRAIYNYLASSGAIRVLPADHPAFRRNESLGYRKKKTAGYLGLLAHLGYDRPRYAGWRIAVAMADNSIRDMMRFMRHSVRAQFEPSIVGDEQVGHFLNMKDLDPLVQDKALDRLGRMKMDHLPERVVNASQGRRLVSFLAQFTHHLDFNDRGSLTKPNAGRLVLRLADQSKSRADKHSLPLGDFEQLVATIRQCVRYGYLAEVAINDETMEIQLRVNKSLARAFGFSHWRPQYSTVVPKGPLLNALSASAITAVSTIAEEAVMVATRRLKVRNEIYPVDQPELAGLEELE